MKDALVNDGALQRLGTILAHLKLPGPGPLALAQIQDAVAAVFGATASGLRVASYRKGKLSLEVKSAARAFEYQAFARDGLLATLRAKPGLDGLTEVVFKNGAWRVHGQR